MKKRQPVHVAQSFNSFDGTDFVASEVIRQRPECGSSLEKLLSTSPNPGDKSYLSKSKNFGRRELVAILNCTPDSYFEGGRYQNSEEAIEYGLRMFQEGAAILDIGGESTRPSSDVPVSSEEEMKRVIPVIKGIRQKSDRPISIDTFKPEVARAALDAGANWINDITGFSDPRMRTLAQQSKATCVIMHMLGAPHTCPTPYYERGVVQDVSSFLQTRAALLLEAGVDPTKIILDPGIGGGAFGKTPEDSLAILKNLKVFIELGYPVLIGLSRKSFMQKILQKPPSEVLSTTLALNTMALLEGVMYIRVHDVTPHKEILTILEGMDKVSS